MLTLEENLTTLATSRGLELFQQGDGWSISLPARSAYVCELNIGPEVLDWYATLRREGEGHDVWTDWVDYTGYDRRAEATMLEDKCCDIRWFTEGWLTASGIRISETRTSQGLFRSTLVEWEHEGRWEEISMCDPNRE